MEILAEKIDDGFAFPLNPKWVLCDEGWKDLYDKLLASDAPNVQDAMAVWFPADVRERIASISAEHPNGFDSNEAKIERWRKRLTISTDLEEHELEMFKSQRQSEMFMAETAELSLQRYKHARSGVSKLRKALLGKRLAHTKKNKDACFFSTALIMLQIGKEADKQTQCAEKRESQRSSRSKTGSNQVLERLRSSLGGIEHETQRRSSLTVATVDSSDISAPPQPLQSRRHSRRKSLTRYLHKKLSSRKHFQRQNSAPS